jgi:ankyrin repeat protein
MPEHRETELTYYIKRNDINKVEEILNNTPDLINKKNNNKQTPIYIAILNKNIDIIKILIKYKPNMLILTNKNDTSLDLLSRQCDIEIIKILYINFEDFQDYFYDYLIQHVSLNNFKKILQIYTYDLERLNKYDKTTLLDTAICYNKYNIARYLIKIGSKPTKESIFTTIETMKESDYTFLNYVIKKSGINIKELKDKFFDYNLLILLEINDLDNIVMKTHKKYKLDINYITSTQNTTLLLSCCEDRKKKLIKYCIENGANVNSIDKDGDSPLLLASQWGDKQTIFSLIQAGAKIDIINNNGNSVCDGIIKGDYYQCFKMIYTYLTPELIKKSFSLSIKYNNMQILKFLINKGHIYKDVLVDNIPLFIYSKIIDNKITKFILGFMPRVDFIEKKEPVEKECLITNEPILENDLYIICPFEHHFKFNTIKKWYHESNSSLCPYCKQNLFNKDSKIYLNLN